MDYPQLESDEVPLLFQDIPSEEILLYQVIFVLAIIILIGLDMALLKICQ